ncbi:poly(3-hydroxyalkanoate) depolymerase [Piscinibacter sp. XHJ-5]|uniref:poly(3-hydroxyalkanoate) depolymerase n=1 Tax=Piscinibacter sp. XHJ-5 TaxID=3037797 RepID=UPI002452AA54|nr:poly(3-hydroxyalkanoate) depolymerase [Piscinibacter sp. XHJ-5]
MIGNAARLSGVRVDCASGLHIGSLHIGRQRLRVGIRPASPSKSEGKPPLLLFNGIGANMELTAPLLHELTEREAIVFDAPGAGASPAPLLPYRMWQLARLARRVLDALGYGVVDVFGVSWGGGVAQQFAAQYPGRCRRLVLAATAMGAVMLPGKPSALWQMISPRRYWDKNHLRRIAPQIYGGDLRHDREALRGHVQAMRGGTTYGYALQLLAMLGWTSLPLLWRIRQPTLVLAGSDDPLVPLANGRWLARLLREGRLEVIDCGHLFLVTRSARIARSIEDFLDEERSV